MKLADVVRPEIAPACKQLHGLLTSGQVKVQPGQLELFGTTLKFEGMPFPSISIEGQAAVIRWQKHPIADVAALPDRLDPTIRQVEIYHDRAVVVTGYGRVVLRS